MTRARAGVETSRVCACACAEVCVIEAVIPPLALFAPPLITPPPPPRAGVDDIVDADVDVDGEDEDEDCFIKPPPLPAFPTVVPPPPTPPTTPNPASTCCVRDGVSEEEYR